MRLENNQQKRLEEKMQKRKDMIIYIVFGIAFFTILLLVFYGISSPDGLESFFQHIIAKCKDILKELRFKSDIY